MSAPELVDCHTHTSFSDGSSTFAENMQAALERGITTIACTDHWGRADFIDCSIKEAKLSDYAQAIREIRDEFPTLSIVHGLEADWYEGCAEDLAQTRGGATFLLGSIHFLNKLPIDWDKDTRIWDELGADGLWELYADQWCQAATSGLFDSMAHPDLPRLFSTKGYAPTKDLTPTFKRMADAAHEGSVHVEINTAGLIKGFADFYPQKELLTSFFKANVPLTVGSDAHSYKRIGDHIEQAYHYARSVGYTSIDAPAPDGDWRTISLEN